MLEHHGVDALAQLAVHAREIQRHAVADVLVGMQFDHQRRFAGEALQLPLHRVHRQQQASRLVAGVGRDVVVQAAAGDGLGGTRGAVQRHGQAAGDRPGQEDADDQDGHSTCDEHVAAARHGARCRGVGVARLLFLQGDVLADFRLPRKRGRARTLAQQCLRLGVAPGVRQVDHLIVEGTRDIARRIDVGAQFDHACTGCGKLFQFVAQVAIALALILDLGERLLVEILAGHHGQCAECDQDV
ncbi:hypothetical protein NB689_002780 [Xanthomonas sacchari]|nr:hypothetical protein [Xanthomonas sacchari]